MCKPKVDARGLRGAGGVTDIAFLVFLKKKYNV